MSNWPPLVVLSCDANPDYSFPAVVTAACWRAHGYPVLVAIVDDPGCRFPKTALRALTNLGCSCFLTMHIAAYGYERRYSAKLARFVSCMDQSPHGYPQWRLTGDADMIVCDPRYIRAAPWDDSDGGPIVWNANTYWGSPWDPRWPLCHVAMTATHWASIFRDAVDSDDIFQRWGKYGQEPNGNFSDELILMAALRAHRPDLLARAALLPRDQTCPMGAKHRLDRHAWTAGSIRRGQLIDAHLPRPAWSDRNWPLVAEFVQLQFARTVDIAALSRFRDAFVAKQRLDPTA